MAVDPKLLDLIICPACREDVLYREGDAVIACTGCGLEYPVRDDIPVMLVSEASKPTG